MAALSIFSTALSPLSDAAAAACRFASATKVEAAAFFAQRHRTTILLYIYAILSSAFCFHDRFIGHCLGFQFCKIQLSAFAMSFHQFQECQPHKRAILFILILLLHLASSRHSMYISRQA